MIGAKDRSSGLHRESSLPVLEKGDSSKALCGLAGPLEGRVTNESSATHLPGLALSGQQLGREAAETGEAEAKEAMG